MNKQKRDKFFSILSEITPDPRTELTFVNPYTLLVAVVLSAQATDKGVNKATLKLFEKVTTPEQMVHLGEAGLKKHINTINLFNNKAKNVIALSRLLIQNFNSQIPRSREDLMSLPGVGQKTANVVLNVVWGEKTIAVDTHVFRVANRTGLAVGTTPHEVEKKLLASVPPQWLEHAHHWLILHGRYVCKARKPLCPQCPVRDQCDYKEKPKT